MPCCLDAPSAFVLLLSSAIVDTYPNIVHVLKISLTITTISDDVLDRKSVPSLTMVTSFRHCLYPVPADDNMSLYFVIFALLTLLCGVVNMLHVNTNNGLLVIRICLDCYGLLWIINPQLVAGDGMLYWELKMASNCTDPYHYAND